MFVSLALLTACTSTPVEPVPPAPVAAPAPAPVVAPTAKTDPMAYDRPVWQVKQHMDTHFAFVTDALFFLFDGDLPGLRDQATMLASHEPLEDVPEGWKPFMDQMQAQAVALQTVEDLPAAARGLVGIAETCASCHTAGKGPAVNLVDFADNQTTATLDRHEWAAYLMWIGLVAPDASIWSMGAGALANPKGPLNDFARTAEAAKDGKARSAAFVELLSTCGPCHTKMGASAR